MPGLCKVCGERAPFGYSEPGPRHQRRSHWVAWACAEHRATVEADWMQYTRGDDREAGATDEREHEARDGEQLPEASSNSKQGSLDL